MNTTPDRLVACTGQPAWDIECSGPAIKVTEIKMDRHYNLWTEVEVVRHVIALVPDVEGPPGWDIEKNPDMYVAVWLRIVQAYLSRCVDRGFKWDAWSSGVDWWCTAENGDEKHFSQHGSDTHTFGMLVLFAAGKEMPK